jgi:hypothetical protein
MDAQINDRGEVIGVQLSIQDVKDRKLLYKPDHRIHPMLREQTRLHRQAYLESLRRQELRDRFKQHPRGGRSQLWAEMEARMQRGDDDV